MTAAKLNSTQACSRQKYCLLHLELWTLERITICQARSYEDQDCESLKQENPKSAKHEGRRGRAHLPIL